MVDGTVYHRETEAINYICSIKKGNVSDFVSKFNKDLLDELGLIGFLKQGVDSDTIHTWKVTETALKFQHSIFREPSFIDHIKGFFSHYILRT